MFVEFGVENWDKVASHSLNYNFYQSVQYARVCEKIYNTKTKCFMLLDENQKVKVAGIAKVRDTHLTFDFGPLVYKGTKPKDVIDFLNYTQEKYKRKIKFTLNRQLLENYGEIKEAPTYFSFSTLVLKIPKTEEDFLHGCNENRRRIIKKVKDKDFVIETEKENLKSFYDIFVQRLKDNKAEEDPPTYDYFKALLDEDAGKLFVCKKDGIIYSGMIGFMFNQYFETRYNTNNTQFIKENAGTYLDYYLIKKFIQTREIENYDFAGYSENAEGKFAGINQYKMSYGGDIKNFEFKEKNV